MEGEGDAFGGLAEFGEVAGAVHDLDDAAGGGDPGAAFELGAVLVDGGRDEVLDEALAEFGRFGLKSSQEVGEGFVVEPGEEGFALRRDGVAVAGTAGPLAEGFVSDEALVLEGLEVLTGGADGKEAVRGDLLDGGSTEAAEGDEDGPAGGVEEMERGDGRHGGGSLVELGGMREGPHPPAGVWLGFGYRDSAKSGAAPVLCSVPNQARRSLDDMSTGRFPGGPRRMDEMHGELTGRVKALCREAGFPLVGVAAAVRAEGARAAAMRALEAGQLGEMGWMDTEWLERATDPGRFLAGARSLVVVGLPARAPDPPKPGDGVRRGVVARYARGRDYHRVFESRLRKVVRQLRAEFGAEARATVDYGPLLERPYAAAAGLGWLGKSTMLLVPGFGPWVLLGVIATTLELEPDPPVRKTCGACRRCIVACPTGAISADGGVVDARRCISYLTIELRGPIPRELRQAIGTRVFGCDDCLDACPVGAGRWEGDAELAAADPGRAWPALRGFIEMDQAAFEARYRGTALMRAKREGMARNACIALGNAGTREDAEVLVGALDDASALVRGHAAWALGRLGRRTGAAVSGWLRKRLAVEEEEWVREELRLALVDADAETGTG